MFYYYIETSFTQDICKAKETKSYDNRLFWSLAIDATVDLFSGDGKGNFKYKDFTETEDGKTCETYERTLADGTVEKMSIVKWFDNGGFDSCDEVTYFEQKEN